MALQILCYRDVQIFPNGLVAGAAACESLELLCEAYHYAEEVNLPEGSMAEVRLYLRKRVETDRKYASDTEVGTFINEFELAQWRLRTVFADTSASETEED